MNRELFLNLNKIHTTKLGLERIKKNLKTSNSSIINELILKIKDSRCKIYKQGKNYYCEIDNIRITINSYSYTIITAHIINDNYNNEWINE